MTGRLEYGVINLYKERGISSFQSVERVRSIFRIKKGGHGGTLDPEAEGVLPVLLGRATRVSSLFLKSNKEYSVDFLLGIKTDTYDMAGQVIERVEEFSLSREEFVKALSSFRGTYLQVPPRYSAIKVKGKRAYELARKGVDFTLPPREVTCLEARLEEYDGEVAKVRVECMSGFYIRSMARDLSEKLSVPVTTRKIVRMRAGFLEVARSHTLADLDLMAREGRLMEAIVNLDDALPQLPGILVDERSEEMVKRGMRPEVFLTMEPPPGVYKIKNRGGEVIALIEKREGNDIKYRCVLSRA